MKHLLFIIVLFIFASCSKKEEPTPTGTASYQCDGQLVKCNAKAKLTLATTSEAYYDILTVTLTTVPQPTTGPEVLDVSFYRSRGGATANFYPREYTQVRNGSPYAVYDPDTSTLVDAGGGGYSGTFAGTGASPSTSVLTDGVFINALL